MEEAQKQVSQQTESLVKEVKEHMASYLTSISITELNRLSSDEQFAEDSVCTSSAVDHIGKIKSSIEDQALKLSKDNI